MWLAFIIGYCGMSIGNGIGAFFLKKSVDKWVSTQYWLSWGYGTAVGIWALN